MTRRKRVRLAVEAVTHVLAHCPDNRTPIGICVGAQWPCRDEVRATCDELGLKFSVCIDPNCWDPTHVTLESAPVA